MEESSKIYGTAAVIIYQNPENGYTVLRVDTQDGVITAVGCMPGISPGEELCMTGSWTSHPAYGQQFKADTVQRQMPTGVQAIYRYLATGAVKHIGPAKAGEIVDAFGESALDVIENRPEELCKIRGISDKKAREISASFRRQMGLRRLLEFLSPYGIKPAVAMRLYRVFGGEAVDAVRDNPYIIASGDFGAEFYLADTLALELGFEADCPQRIEAAVIFELTHNLTNGHTFLPYEKLLTATSQLIEVETEPVSEAVEVLCDLGLVAREKVAGQDACYLAEIHYAEEYTGKKLISMSEDTALSEENIDSFIEKAERELHVTYSAEQRAAVHLASCHRVMVLTGGPGTGKTTTIRAILALFDMMGFKTALCAPTGRAAKRMGEVCSREAYTIHRLLGTSLGDEDRLVFEHDENDPIDADAVIADECSMIDIMLMSSFLKALRPGCRLIMVGDADQLPSVGPGNVFSDIIRSGRIMTVKLTEIFRQARKSRIVTSAHMINSGELPDLKENSGDFFFMCRRDPKKAVETIISLVSRRLPENMHIPPENIQVLSPTRRYEMGTENLNRLLQEALNPEGKGKKEKQSGDFIYREGDKVMQIKNNYDIMWKTKDGFTSGTGVFNGDIGIISEIDYTRETVTVEFDDKRVNYLYEQLSELEPAYAMTVHKSQGSEYDTVILAAGNAAQSLLVRNVLYTAVTRAKTLLIIVGDDTAVQKMVENDRRQRRYSGLRARLAGDY